MSILSVGSGQSYATLSAAVAASVNGDTIRVQAGDYVDDFVTIGHALTIESVGGLAHFIAATSPPNGKAIMTVDASLVLSGFEFSGAVVADGNGAGIRYEAGSLSISNSWFHDNQDGLLGNAAAGGTISIDHSEFDHNGAGDGLTHNIYIGAIDAFTLTNSYIHDAVVGHEVKSRALGNTITGNVISDGTTGTGSYLIDLPNGGTADITGNTLVKGPETGNTNYIRVGEEGGVYPGSSVAVSGNVFINDIPPGQTAEAVFAQNGVPTSLAGNTLYGFDPKDYAIGASTADNSLQSLPGPAVVPPVAFAVPEPNMVPVMLLAAVAARWRSGRRRRAARRAAHMPGVSRER